MAVTTSVRTRVPWSVVVAALLAGVLAGCGAAPGGVGSADDEPTLRTSDLLVSAGVLPDGWHDSNSQGIDYRTTVCGVDIEPVSPARATSIRFSEGPVGPFLEQHVRIYDEEDVAAEVIDALRSALRDCEGYVATGTASDSPEARFAVEPLTVPGAPADSVAWRQVSQGDVPITADVLLLRRGPAAVLLMSYALRATPDAAVLAGAAAAVPEVD